MSDSSGRKRGTSARSKSLLTPVSLLERLFSDLATSGLPVTSADIATLRRRCESEGDSFIYKTLKSIEDLLLVTLETGTFPAQKSFRTIPGTVIPLFLGGLWRGVIDESGVLLPDFAEHNYCARCVSALLQVSASFSKYADSFPKELIPAYLQEFVEVDQNLANLNLRWNDSVIFIAKTIIANVLKGVTLKHIVPKHGPGAVATGERDEQKWAFKRLYDQLHASYPYYDMFMSGRMELRDPDRLAWYRNLERGAKPTAKLHIVPKSATKLRTICIEPLEMQFIQQGQMKILVDRMKSHPLTAGRINFDDQTINQRLAVHGSITGELATIDLSSASDRLSLQLVELLFSGDSPYPLKDSYPMTKDESIERWDYRRNSGNPSSAGRPYHSVKDEVLHYLLASRSPQIRLPNGDILVSKKFAPMGSATCFPVQALCFWALCVAALSRAENVNYTLVAGRVHVFGDDIIVPTKHADCVIGVLEEVGLVANRQKTFINGRFRESCGIYAFNGVDVTPIRFKTALPQNFGDGRGWSAWLSYAHACERNGYLAIAGEIYTYAEHVLGIDLPYGLPECGYFCRLARDPFDVIGGMKPSHDVRWNKRLQRLEIRTLGVRARNRRVRFESDYHRYLRGLITSFLESDPSITVVARSAKTKAAWHPIL